MVKKLLEHFIKKNCKKQSKKNLGKKKVIKKKGNKEISYMSNGKNIILHLIAGLIKTFWRRR